MPEYLKDLREKLSNLEGSLVRVKSIKGIEPNAKEYLNKLSKEGLIETEEGIEETAKNIRANLQEDHFPANPKYFGRVPACFYCAYNSICPFSLTRR